MPKRWMLAGLLVAMAAAAPCRAAIRWYDDYNEGLEAAKKAGRLMVIVFGLDEDKDGAFSKKTFDKEQLAAFHRMFVYIYVGMTAKNGTVSHGLFSKFPPGEGALSFPIIFFVDGEEKILKKLDGRQDPTALAKEMATLLKKHGVPPSPKQTREVQESLDRANALLAKKQYGGAAKLYKSIVDAGVKMPAVDTAKKELATIEELAKKQLESARADLTDKAYPDAARKLADLVETFSPLPESKEAHDELAKLRALPEAKAALEEAAKKEAARPQPGAAADANDPASDFFTEEELDALDRMASADEAKPTAEADSGAAAAECRKLLTLARSWIANNRPDKARDLLDQIVVKHPDTVFADQAKALIEKLK
ncbi:MAG TPA: hypothetical protein PLE19_02350 [Planctomycetota bacterium]|nr:hypothetical protein [Planctomycetota bacterium]HRR79782.1 hypothetical protein [Planctomycetota bacterium]HRT96926.1 hypothetical protein [Planctomycetota bacterium]